MRILHFIGLSGIGGVERQFQRFITFFSAHRDEFKEYSHAVLAYTNTIHPDIKRDIAAGASAIHIFKKTFPDIFLPPLIRPYRCRRIFSAHSYDVLLTTSILRNPIQEKTIRLFPGLKIFYDKGWSSQHTEKKKDKLIYSVGLDITPNL